MGLNDQQVSSIIQRLTKWQKWVWRRCQWWAPLNNEVNKEGADENEEDCSDNDNSNEADAGDEEEKEESADEELADGEVSDEAEFM